MATYIPAVVEEYLRIVEGGERPVCDEQRQFAVLVRDSYAAGDCYTDDALLSSYLSLEKYWSFKLFPWERCLLALTLCTFRRDDEAPRWPTLLLYVSRGAGKNGFASFGAFCAVSPYNPIKNYDVDITAPSEQQAKRSFDDVWEVCETPANTRILRHYFEWTKSEITGKKNRGKVRYRTSSPKSKDGLRSGLIIFDEVHQYADYALIDVFITGHGKVAHPRTWYLSTDGYVRMGPLDDLKERGRRVLAGAEDDGGFLPFMCCVPDKSLAGDRDAWYMANPSLEYLPTLLQAYETEYAAYASNPRPGASFIVKRLNCVDANTASGVTSWENIIRASSPLPDLTGYAAIAALDYARLRDFAAAGFWTRDGDKRYWITHSWVCEQSPDLERIKAPWRDWVDMGLLTLVRGPEIPPEFLAEWIANEGAKYDIRTLSLDSYRFALMRSALEAAGFDAKKDGRNNIKLIRNSTIMQAAPLIDSLFTTGNLSWGAPNPLMQWYTNNASAKLDAKGNITYGKQEPVTRKTDGFSAMVAGACWDGLLPVGKPAALKPLGVITF